MKFKKTLVSDIGDVIIGITPDDMYAYLSLIPLQAQSVFDADTVFQLLRAEEIVHGVQDDLIRALIQQVNTTQFPISNHEIVAGTPPQQGSDAVIRYHFKTDREVHLIEDPEGNIDYKELGLINNVLAGDLLAEKIPMTQTIPGKDIYGREVPGTHPRDVDFVAGNNVRMAPDRLSCYAEVDGQVYLKRMTVQVSPIYEVPQDVDLNTGNITFNGSVVVYGNVLSGFSVRAKENITILGVVESCNLVAGGNIFIKKGIKGGEKAVIQAKGDLTVKFIESATVECHGKLMVETSIVNSDITCYSKVLVARGKGLIVGGHVRAINGIECLEVGSKLGVQTRITVGDKFVVRARLDETATKIESLKEFLHKVSEVLSNLGALDINSLPPAKLQQLQKILDQKTEVLSQIKEIEEKREKLGILFQAECLARLKVRNVAYPNVTITVGHSNLTSKNEYRSPSFYEDSSSRTVKIGTAL